MGNADSPNPGLADVVTIDGPSGAGKGTVAGLLAARLGWHLLDSGALYRVVGVVAERRGVDLADADALAAMARGLDIAFTESVTDDAVSVAVVVDGTDETSAIRAAEAEDPASRVAAVTDVRTVLGDVQRSFRRPPGLVADGRDMGTVVFPDARLKIFLTASVGVRAERRMRQLAADRRRLKDQHAGDSLRAPRGDSAAALTAVRARTEARDQRDRTRDVSPLVPATDAVTIDSTALSIDSVMTEVMALVRKRGLER